MALPRRRPRDVLLLRSAAGHLLAAGELAAALEQPAAQGDGHRDGTDSDSDSDCDDDSEETDSEDEHSNVENTTSDDSDVENKTSYGGSSSHKTFSGRPPKKLPVTCPGCNFEHWLVVMDPPPGDPSNPNVSRDELIDTYVKTLAQVIGSEEKARKKIYSVSTSHYFAFGACISEELSFKLKELPKVRWALADSYCLDVKNKDYGGEPFINGNAVPYDPKYHKEWVRNNDRDNRSPNLDRSSVRRDNIENFQNRDVPTRRTRSKSPSPQCQQTMEPHDVPPVHAQDNMPPASPSPSNGDPPTYQHHVKSPQASDIPSFGQNCQQCGAPVHQVGNQDLQDSPHHRMRDDNTDARMRDDNNNGCQRGRSDYHNGNAKASQTTLHGANALPRQSGSEPGIVHRHYYCNVHYHYYY